VSEAAARSVILYHHHMIVFPTNSLTVGYLEHSILKSTRVSLLVDENQGFDQFVVSDFEKNFHVFGAA